MPSEYSLWQLLRRNLPGVHWQRIEGIRGVPDVNGCDDGVEFWIEGKSIREGETRVRFERGQVAWLVAGAHAGRRCFVLVRRSDEILLYRGSAALSLSRDGICSTSPLLRLCRPWAWPRLREALRSG